jgi:osmoprotectant transport system permease protein
MFHFIGLHAAELTQLTLEHIFLVVISLALALAAGVPLGILISRKRRLTRIVLGINQVIQTIPSLALLGFLLAVPWIGERAARIAIAALFLYALLPIIQNTYVGITSIDRGVREAAIAMGMTSGQLLRQLELPLSLSIVLAGIRVSAVTTIGIATIAAAVGAGGLGELIFRGLAMVDTRMILAGAVPAAILAIIAEFGLGAVEKRFRVAR